MLWNSFIRSYIFEWEIGQWTTIRKYYGQKHGWPSLRYCRNIALEGSSIPWGSSHLNRDLNPAFPKYKLGLLTAGLQVEYGCMPLLSVCSTMLGACGIDCLWSLGVMILTGENRGTRRHTCPIPSWYNTNPTVVWDRAWAYAMSDWRRSAWTLTGPYDVTAYNVRLSIAYSLLKLEPQYCRADQSCSIRVAIFM